MELHPLPRRLPLCLSPWYRSHVIFRRIRRRPRQIWFVESGGERFERLCRHSCRLRVRLYKRRFATLNPKSSGLSMQSILCCLHLAPSSQTLNPPLDSCLIVAKLFLLVDHFFATCSPCCIAMAIVRPPRKPATISGGGTDSSCISMIQVSRRFCNVATDASGGKGMRTGRRIRPRIVPPIWSENGTLHLQPLRRSTAMDPSQKVLWRR